MLAIENWTLSNLYISHYHYYTCHQLLECKDQLAFGSSVREKTPCIVDLLLRRPNFPFQFFSLSHTILYVFQRDWSPCLRPFLLVRYQKLFHDPLQFHNIENFCFFVEGYRFPLYIFETFNV